MKIKFFFDIFLIRIIFKEDQALLYSAKMSSTFSGYASYLTNATGFLAANAKHNIFSSQTDKINSNFLSLSVVSEDSFDLLKKFVGYGVVSAAVAGSAFYFGYNYAKNRHRFDPRSREDSRNEQV